GPQFYLNAGIVIRSISPVERPRWDNRHIYTRLGDEPLRQAMDGEDNSFDEVSRAIIIERALKRDFLPWFTEMQELPRVIKLFDRRELWPPSTLIEEEAQAYMRTLVSG